VARDHIHQAQTEECFCCWFIVFLLDLLVPSITEWEMYITAQGPRLRIDLYCVEWDVKL